MASDPRFLAAQAQSAQTSLSRRRAAIDACRKAVAAAPSSAAAEHNLAAALGDAGRWTEAETHIRQAMAKGSRAAETMLVLARCLQSRGALDEAEAAFLRSLQARPTFYDAHVDLAQLRWMRTGDASSALATLDRAMLGAPGDPALSMARLATLENTGRAAEAYALAQAILLKAPGGAQITIRAAQLATTLGDAAAALTLAERAFALAPQDNVASVTLITACLGAGEARRAETQALQLLQRAPDDQHAIALLATAWRLLGDARYRDLFDYDALVQPSMLDVPPGWSSLPDYLADLRDALREAHVARSHPFGQSIRHGSQRPDITDIGDPAIDALPRALGGPISRYIAGLGAGDDPLRRRNLGGYAFQGIWSIRMQAGGYHVDHVHPAGWISSACYIEVPSTQTGHEGWIRFGEPGVPTLPSLHAERFIEPSPGMIVLFPSYMWHGVVPYTAPGARMTFAFDLEPSPDQGASG